MGDFNICENIGEMLQQQIRIRNLLNMMRFNQNNCNNVDCITEGIQLPRDADDSFDILSVLFIFALMVGVLFSLTRPSFVRNKGNSINKNNKDDDHTDQNGRPISQM